MRSIDRVRRFGVHALLDRENPAADAEIKAHAQRFEEACRSKDLPIFVVDNVAKWAYSHGDKEWSYEALPCVAPVRPTMFFEWPNSPGNERRLALITSQRFHDVDLDAILSDDLARNAMTDAERKGFEGGVGWLLSIDMSIETNKADGRRILGPIGSFNLVLDRNGRIVGNRYEVNPVWHRSDPGAMQLFASTLSPLQSLAFLHCRNVEVDDVTPPAKLSKKYQRFTGRPLASYKQIRLQVPRRSGGGGSGEPTGMTALHIVDGHFAHYGDCCPGEHEPKGRLFGRHQGIYWVESHARGNPERGTRHTDRDLTIPEGT